MRKDCLHAYDKRRAKMQAAIFLIFSNVIYQCKYITKSSKVFLHTFTFLGPSIVEPRCFFGVNMLIIRSKLPNTEPFDDLRCLPTLPGVERWALYSASSTEREASLGQ